MRPRARALKTRAAVGEPVSLGRGEEGRRMALGSPSLPEQPPREQPQPSGDPQLDALNERLREIEAARANEWKQPAVAQPPTGQRTDELSEGEIEAQLRAIEAERANVWRGGAA
jgi:hypothetical protein